MSPVLFNNWGSVYQLDSLRDILNFNFLEKIDYYGRLCNRKYASEDYRTLGHLIINSDKLFNDRTEVNKLLDKIIDHYDDIIIEKSSRVIKYNGHNEYSLYDVFVEKKVSFLKQLIKILDLIHKNGRDPEKEYIKHVFEKFPEIEDESIVKECIYKTEETKNEVSFFIGLKRSILSKTLCNLAKNEKNSLKTIEMDLYSHYEKKMV